jgi:hypothetical protein
MFTRIMLFLFCVATNQIYTMQQNQLPQQIKPYFGVAVPPQKENLQAYLEYRASIEQQKNQLHSKTRNCCPGSVKKFYLVPPLFDL